TWWSFLMSTAHGAGLMVAPILIGAGAATDAAASSDHAIAAVQANGLSIPGSVLGITLHVAAMLAVMSVVALLVYDHVGLQIVKKAWINLDALWAAAFVMAGPLTLGHQIVARVDGDGARVGVPWLGWTCGECAYCRSGRENLCVRARFTGRDLDGGYAEWTVADERFCFPLPDDADALQLAPLL